MPFPPSSILAFTVASVGFLPLTILSFLNRPFSPGPIFFSSLSALWQTPHCSKTSLPFAASPFRRHASAGEQTANGETRNRVIFEFGAWYSSSYNPDGSAWTARFRPAGGFRINFVKRESSGKLLAAGHFVDADDALVEYRHVLHQTVDIGALVDGISCSIQSERGMLRKYMRSCSTRLFRLCISIRFSRV